MIANTTDFSPQDDDSDLQQDGDVALIDFLLGEFALYRPIEKGTIEQHHYAIKRFDRFLGRQSMLSDLRDEIVSNCLVWCENTMHYKPKTTKNTRGTLLALWNYAYEEGHLAERHGRVRKIKVTIPNPEAWEFHEIAYWMQATEIFSGESYGNGVSKVDWWMCYGAMSYESALRGCDVRTLTFASINHRNKVSIIQQKTKEVQTVELSDNCMYYINRIREPQREIILEFPHSDGHFYDEFYRITQAAGIKGQPKYFRRSAATHKEMDEPGTAGDLLGHKTVGLAKKHYIDRRQLPTPKVPIPIPAPNQLALLIGPTSTC